MSRLRDRIAIVTGAASGIGEAVARRFAAEGANVLLTDLSPKVEGVAAEIGAAARWIVSDHTKPEACAAAVEKAVAEFGGLDILHNNAGVPQFGGVEDIAPEEYRRVIEANLVGPFLMTRAAVPALRKAAAAGRDATVLFTGSIQSLMVRPGYTAYAASKHGVGGLVGSIALEYAPIPIRVNAVCPGTIDTPLVRDIARKSGDEEGWLKRFREGIPLRRMIRTEEIAAAATFLVSEEARAITGVMLPVDGGLTAR